jgi:hypothetical protein
MSDSEHDRKHELECLRLASELTQLANDLLDLDLKVHCLRMSNILNERAEQGPMATAPVLSSSYH